MSSNRIPIILATAFTLGCSEDALRPTVQSDAPRLQASVSGGVIHRVSAGGPDNCVGFLGLKPGCDANQALVALQRADGSVTGEWTDRFGKFGGVHVVLNCVNVIGNEAWVSGVITVSSPKDLIGSPVILRVRDNGISANDPPDEISTTQFDTFGGCNAAPDLDLFVAPQGQVVVQ